jgi:Ran GTPase-activating protein (RanGAP) involved in mRNA processing and transport
MMTLTLAEALVALSENSATEIDLSDRKLGREGAEAIAEALKVNKVVEKLNLKRCAIGDEGAIAIAEALKVNNTLKEIILIQNNFNAKGVVALAAALEINKSIMTMNLMGNYIYDEGAKAIAKALRVNKHLEALNLGAGDIQDEGAKAIAKALEVNKHLKELDLRNNVLQENGGTAIADSLLLNETLLRLNLNENGIGDNGAIALAEALIHNNTLCRLELDENNIGDNGGIAIAEALKTNRSLAWLDLDSHYMIGDGLEALAAALETNKIIIYITLLYDQEELEIPQAIFDRINASILRNQKYIILTDDALYKFENADNPESFDDVMRLIKMLMTTRQALDRENFPKDSTQYKELEFAITLQQVPIYINQGLHAEAIEMLSAEKSQRYYRKLTQEAFINIVENLLALRKPEETEAERNEYYLTITKALARVDDNNKHKKTLLEFAKTLYQHPPQHLPVPRKSLGELGLRTQECPTLLCHRWQNTLEGVEKVRPRSHSVPPIKATKFVI